MIHKRGFRFSTVPPFFIDGTPVGPKYDLLSPDNVYLLLNKNKGPFEDLYTNSAFVEAW